MEKALPAVAPDGIYRLMSATAKVFKNGRSQAIRMPREFRVAGTEVHLRRVPEGILIVERDPWEVCRDACRELPEEIFAAIKKRDGKCMQKRVWWWQEEQRTPRKSSARKSK